MEKIYSLIKSFYWISLLFLIAFDVHAEPCQAVRDFIIEEKAVQFCYYEQNEAWITKDCIKKKQCDAKSLFDVASKRRIRLSADELQGGKNPSNVLCERLGGAVMIGATPEGTGQATFCMGKDESMIDCNSLINAVPAVKHPTAKPSE